MSEDVKRESRLTSWKEIGAYFGRDERTVKRWERQRGMPVHRLPGGAGTSVFAFADELEMWIRGADTQARSAPAASDDVVQTPTAPPSWGSQIRLGVVAAAIAVVVAGSVVVGFQDRIFGTLSQAAAPKQQIATPRHTPTQEVSEVYLNGVYNWSKRTPDGLNRAVHLFSEAIAMDPQYAEAYVGLANTYNLLREFTLMPPQEAYPKARAAAERAIALDANLSEAHSSLAFGLFYWYRDVPAAEREFELALKLDPKSVQVHHWYATALLTMGAFDRSLAEIDIAQKLDPESRSILADKGLILYYAGRKQEAVSLLEQLAASDPDFLSPASYLSSIHLAEREYDAYLREERKVAGLLGDAARMRVAAAAEEAYRESGGAGLLKALLSAREAAFRDGKAGHYALAQAYAMLGDSAQAMSQLKAALHENEESIIYVRIELAFADMRTMPELQQLDAEVGMPPFSG